MVAVKQEINQHTEALDFARQMKRADLVAQEEQTIAVMQEYAPAELTREEISKEVEEIVRELGNEFDKIMPVAAQRLRGRADGRLINEVVSGLTVRRTKSRHGP